MKTLLLVFALACITILLAGSGENRPQVRSCNVPKAEFKRQEIQDLYNKVKKISCEVDSLTSSNIQLIKQIDQ